MHDGIYLDSKDSDFTFLSNNTMFKRSAAFFDAKGSSIKMAHRNSEENLEFFYFIDNNYVPSDYRNLGLSDKSSLYYTVKLLNNTYSENTISGVATLENPIQCMDSVSQTNVNVSMLILCLTGVLIILGTLPFVLSLKQLIA
jgi:hypothetical protein